MTQQKLDLRERIAAARRNLDSPYLGSFVDDLLADCEAEIERLNRQLAAATRIHLALVKSSDEQEKEIADVEHQLHEQDVWAIDQIAALRRQVEERDAQDVAKRAEIDRIGREVLVEAKAEVDVEMQLRHEIAALTEALKGADTVLRLARFYLQNHHYAEPVCVKINTWLSLRKEQL